MNPRRRKGLFQLEKQVPYLPKLKRIGGGGGTRRLDQERRLKKGKLVAQTREHIKQGWKACRRASGERKGNFAIR